MLCIFSCSIQRPLGRDFEGQRSKGTLWDLAPEAASAYPPPEACRACFGQLSLVAFGQKTFKQNRPCQWPMLQLGEGRKFDYQQNVAVSVELRAYFHDVAGSGQPMLGRICWVLA